MGSMLDKAKEIPVANNIRREVTDDEIELAVAWLKGDISSGQAAKAYGKTDVSNTTTRLASVLRHAVATKKVIVNLAVGTTTA
jgi:hypothetical protein